MTTNDDLTDDGFADQVRRAVRALPDAPLALQRRASALWPQTSPLQAVGDALRRIVAVLAFDSWAPTGPALAMRSAATATRHLMFNAEGRDVDLRIAPGRSGYTLSGQVLGPDSEGEIELLNPSANVSAGQAALDDLGGFRLDGVGEGVYRLTLRVGGDQIELPPLDVGAPPR